MTRRLHRFQRQVPSARQIRDFVAQAVLDAGAPTQVIEEFRLVASEIASNAIQHGSGQFIVVLVRSNASKWEMEVHSEASPNLRLPPHREWITPPPTDSSGRGLAIADSLMDACRARHIGPTLAIVCTKLKSPPALQSCQ